MVLDTVRAAALVTPLGVHHTTVMVHQRVSPALHGRPSVDHNLVAHPTQAPVDVAGVGLVLVGIVLAAVLAVRMRRRRASQPGGGYAGRLGADGSSAEQLPTSSDVQDRWRRLAGAPEADLDAELYARRTTTAQNSAPPSAAAPDRTDRREVETTHVGGLEIESAAGAPAQARFLGPDEAGYHTPDVGTTPLDVGTTPLDVGTTPLLDDDQAVADHSVDGPTGGLLALPPAVADHSTDAPTGSLLALPPAASGADGHPASYALEHVRARLSAVSTPQVVALSVIDSAGRVLAGATDDEVTSELRSLMAESGVGSSADLVQPLHFANDRRGAMLLLPTGANALLGALVYDKGDLQATRAQLRDLAHEIGDAMRAVS